MGNADSTLERWETWAEHITCPPEEHLKTAEVREFYLGRGPKDRKLRGRIRQRIAGCATCFERSFLLYPPSHRIINVPSARESATEC